MIIFVLRHADKQGDPPEADALSAAGRERAELLARMLAESGVTVAYDSGYARARQTLEPLKRLRGDALTQGTRGCTGGGPLHGRRGVRAQ